MLGLLVRPISMIAEIFIFISHLQRLLSTLERMSMFFDRKMDIILAPNGIFLEARCKLWRGTPSTDF